MLVSLKWLSEYVEVPDDTQAFCDRLDLTGTGVEGVNETGAAFTKVVTGQIVAKDHHPDSDHLWVCQVDVGQNHLDDKGNPAPLQIVCGAQNFNAGDHVAVALVGAELPGGVKIKKSKLRGVVSHGMNCSARELNLGSEYDGIMILPEDAPIGVPFEKYLGLSDTILDLEITPNRPDSLSMMGMAREVGAMYRKDVSYPSFDLQEDADMPLASDLASVEITDADRCPRYTARVIKDVKIGPSPQWLADRITAAGARPINNVVDITNYILFLLGQPLHAFDFDKIKSADGKAHIIVRPAEDGEKFTTLDGEDRVLKPDMTVIATPERPVALAGVMGGLDSEVSEETTTVLLEAATFSRAHTSRTSRNLSLISESSMRYERGVDDNPVADNSAAAAALIAQVCGGKVCPGIVDVWEERTEPCELSLRIPRLQQMMGAEIPEDFIKDCLTRLGCKVEETDDPQALDVLAPTFRPDLEREIDLYEEVLRLWGMDRIESTLPRSAGRVGSHTRKQKILATINESMRASGLNETQTYSFAEPNELDKLRMSRRGLGEAVELLNPMNAEQSVMRQSIIPGLLRSVVYNQSHGVHNIQLYETGVVFFAHEGSKKPKEKEKLAGIMVGSMAGAGWNTNPVPFDFFDGKGVIENLTRELSIPKLHFKPVTEEDFGHLQPGRGAEIYSAGSVLGWVGELHPLAVAAYEAEGPVVAFELDIEALENCACPARDFVDIPTFPAVEMDIALVVDEDLTNERLEHCIRSAGGKLLEDVHLFDVYRDLVRVGKGKKSMAYSLTYRAPDRTLTSEEVEKTHTRLLKKVSAATGAEIR
ncbi:MAG: phenylalanine--tRNA ligase subunit beta [Eggerthellaceae bacterium]|jgi:phenylalanyl-tRNA synthetase beta chain